MTLELTHVQDRNTRTGDDGKRRGGREERARRGKSEGGSEVGWREKGRVGVRGDGNDGREGQVG